MTSKAKLGGVKHGLTPIASAVVLAVVGFGLVGSAAAQTAAPAKPADEATPALKLETVIVTANRRIETLEKVPQSISVVNAADLERNNVRELDDLIKLAPALSISVGTQVGTNSINMRGIGSLSNNLGIEGDVAVILDDLPFAQPQQAFKDLHDVARIEILKGPQSTLYGKSSIAGAVVITTSPIGSGPVSGKLSTFLTSDGEYRVGGTVSGRVSDKVGIRLSASKTDFKGLLHNLTNDTYTNGSGGENLTGKVEWALTNDLDVALSAYYSDSKATGNTSALIFMDPRVGSLIRNNTALTNTVLFRDITPSTRNRDVRLDDESSLSQRDSGAGLRINYLFPAGSFLANHALTSITSFNKNDSNDKRDNDGTEGKLAQYYPLINDAGATVKTTSGIVDGFRINGFTNLKTTTQELRLTSPDSGNFRYVVGLWYAKNSLDRQYLRGMYGIKQSNYTEYEGATSAQNTAVYANTTWEFMPKHTLTLGGRLNRETNNYTFTTIGSLATTTVPAVSPYTHNPAYTAPEHSEGAFTGKAAYAYQVNPGTMVYASYATGRKGVAYDLTSGANNKNVFNFLPLPALDSSLKCNT